MTTRELKAMELAARVPLTFCDGEWIVPAQTGSTPYRVQLGRDGATCTCEDWLLRQQDCKHVIAARLVTEREGRGQAPEIGTDAEPVRETYKQNWPAYNQAQIHEKRRFQVLLADLRRGSPEPPYKGGLPRTPMADVIFACAFKVYSTFSSRRFGTDLLEAVEKGHLSRPMHPNKVNAHLKNTDLTPVFRQLITKSSLPLRAVEATFAPGSTGFSVSRFARWFDEKYGTHRSGHDWVKAHAMCGVKTNVVTAVEILDRDAADSPQFKPLVEATAENFTVGGVVADYAYLSHANLGLVDQLGGAAFVPFKVNSVAGEAGSVCERLFFYYGFRRDEFLAHYHQRSNAESTFSMVKAKFTGHVRSRTDAAMRNEAYCKFLCHNICVLIQSRCELGIEAEFRPEQPSTPSVTPHQDGERRQELSCARRPSPAPNPTCGCRG